MFDNLLWAQPIGTKSSFAWRDSEPISILFDPRPPSMFSIGLAIAIASIWAAYAYVCRLEHETMRRVLRPGVSCDVDGFGCNGIWPLLGTGMVLISAVSLK